MQLGFLRLSEQCFTERPKELAYYERVARVGKSHKQPTYLGGQLGAETQHAEAMAVKKREAGVLARQLFPESPDTEVPFPHVDVVQNHDTLGAQLGPPRLEVVPDRLVGMEAVDVQQIDAAVAKLRERLIECRSHEPRERTEVLIVERRPLLEHPLVVLAGVRVALPGVNGVTGRVE